MIKDFFKSYLKKQHYSIKVIALFLLLISGLMPMKVTGQQYPVKLVPVVIPPYSLRLADYAASTDNKLQLQVLMTDLLEPQHQTGIKFSLEAGLNVVPIARSNDFVVGMNPFTLYPGNNITLTNVDLRSLFELQNLAGINAVQYSKPLADGVYQFCFQAYDYYTKNNLSSKTCTTVFMVQYDPPMLILPQNAEKIQALAPYGGGAGVVFQWMPRQIAPNTCYIFTLKELWDQGQSPISGFLSAPPLWREETYAPTLYYGIDKTQLMPGKRYAWQVQAKSGNPVVGANATDDNGVYKNNGLSEIFYFDYVENCAVPTLLMAKNVGKGRVEIRWSLAGQPGGLYNVQYRKKGSSAEWATQQSYQATAILTGLEDKTEYEYRVGTVCGSTQTFGDSNPTTGGNSAGNAYSYSGIQLFTTDGSSSNNNYQCGIMPAVDIANKTPLQTMLGNNEVFTAGDFPVTVLSAQGSNGIYTGTGFIEVPYLADTKIKVSFTNIKLNTDKKLIEGTVETTYDPNETAVHYASGGLGETFGDAGVKEVIVDYVISDIKYTATPPPGKITVYGDSGNGGSPSQQDFPGGKDYEIKDKEGNIWTVDENGNVTKTGKVAEGGASNSTNTDGVSGSGSNAAVTQYTAKGIKIDWKEAAAGKFAYDTPEKTKLPTSKYPSVKDADNNTVYVPYKATVNKQTELFDARVNISDPSLKDGKIIFKTLGTGKAIEVTELSKTDTERNYQLKLPGTFDYAEEEVIAVLMPKETGSKQKVIGSFRLVHLSPEDINVSLVPLDAVSQSNLQAQSAKLNQIYNKIGVKFNVKEEPVLNISSIVSGDTINSEDSDLMSTYSPQQQQINALYKGTDARYVLFVTDKKSSTGQNGYMRLNGQFGYVYGNAPAKTGSHELGHGVFKLEHPWKALGTTEKGTNLLMDYAAGEELSHLDWKQINDPAFKLYAFQGQSAGESVDKTFILIEDGYFMTPSNKLIKLVKGTELSFYCSPPQSYQNNVLHGFKTPDGFYWDNMTQYHLNQKTFEGFYKVTKDKNDWVKDNAGNRILYADPNFKNNGAGKYPVYFVQWINLENNKSEYRIYKGELDINNSQLATDKYFKGDIQDMSSPMSNTLVETITSTGCQQQVQNKGDLYQTINDPQGKYEIKIFKNKDGKLSTEFKLKSQGNSKTKEQQRAIEQQVEALMNEKLQELGGLDGNESAEEKKQTEDGGEFWVRKMNGRAWLNTIGDLGESVWENAAMPENYWNKDKNYNEANIHIPPTFAGVGDGVIGEISDYPQLIKLGYDVSTKQEVREGLWKTVKNINLESIKTAATGALKNKWNAYTNSPGHITYHEMGKDGVTVVSMAMGAGFFKKGADGLKDGIEDTGEKFIKKEAGNIAESFNELLKNPKFKQIYEPLENGSHIRKFGDGVTVAEEASLKLFIQDNYYSDFNKALAGEIPMTAEYNEMKKLMESAQSKLPKYNGTVFRGAGKAESDFAKSLSVGQDFNFNGRFTSSSVSESEAGMFMYGGKGDIMWKINSKSGTDIRVINPKEQEILLRSNAKYKLESITPKEGNSTVLIYEITEQ
ncbi:fibronectin type III domain-containing protein [Chryseobacterium sp.]|uniref:fibronectin type III domain-containing protein n=1 Tax=Chryseobacterium sp. TaxID=1871047 RepID=UPI0028983D23|nr:fibronectin type III domain-containing protein [Chryseobacterium sp.]